MRSIPAVFVAMLTVGLLSPEPASAQERRGFFFGIGGGFGSAGVNCEGCDREDRDSSGVVYFKVGWSLNPQTVLGMEVGGYKDLEIDLGLSGAANIFQVSGTLTLYPKLASGFFVKGGAGISEIDVDVKLLGSTKTFDLGRGFGVIAGAGYDIPVGRRVAITPAIDYWYGKPGDLEIDLASNWKQNVIAATIGITFP